MSTLHKPVLLKEVIKYLNLKSGSNVVDGTFGGGGHSREILKKIKPNGKLLAIDLNIEALKHLNTKTQKNVVLVNDNFKNLKKIIEKNKEFFTLTSPNLSLKSRGIKVDGILLDLGLSSDELEKSGRGFSFQKDEPLDMRFDLKQDLTAAEILNNYSLENLHDIFKTLGEYPHARRLSQGILEKRKLKKFQTTKDLVDLVLEINPRKHYHRLHPATKIFQALRIAVNDELENLKSVLPQAIEILQPGGRLVVISFHALEDRIVKHYFKELVRLRPTNPNKYATKLDYGGQAPCVKILTKKPIIPSEEERKQNPRSRSAKMRVIEKL